MADKISSIKLPNGTTFDIKAKAIDDGAISITTTGSGNAITALSESSGTITATKGASFANASHTHSPSDINGGYLDSSIYIHTHPQGGGSIIPFINNDIAFLTARGGTVSIYTTSSTDYTAQTLTAVGQITSTNNTITNLFDGSSSYASISSIIDNTTDVLIIDITTPQDIHYTTKFYIDFGNPWWGPKDISLYLWNDNKNTTSPTNYEQVYRLMGSTTNKTDGHWMLHTSGYTWYKDSNKTVGGYGFNKIRWVLTNWNNTTGNRIAQIGVINYGSTLQRMTTMSRGIDDQVWRSITPAANNTYDLGSSTNKWANVYATTFNGNATSATKATQDSDGNAINTTYYKASNPSGYTSNTGTVTSVTVQGSNGLSGSGTITSSGTVTLSNAGVRSITQDSSDGHKLTINTNGSTSTITIPDNNTTYSAATTSAAGLMSASDKTKLDGIATGATAVTSSTVSGWGFKTTDNNTTYTLTQDASDGHKITLTPSSGSATTITIPDNNTTYSSQTAASGGTAVSLVTTGEKYTWNSKLDSYQAGDSYTVSANQALCVGLLYSTTVFRGFITLPKYISASSVTVTTTPTYTIKEGGKSFTPTSTTFSVNNGRLQVSCAIAASTATANYTATLYSSSGAVTFTFS